MFSLHSHKRETAPARGRWPGNTAKIRSPLERSLGDTSEGKIRPGSGRWLQWRFPQWVHLEVALSGNFPDATGTGISRRQVPTLREQRICAHFARSGGGEAPANLKGVGLVGRPLWRRATGPQTRKGARQRRAHHPVRARAFPPRAPPASPAGRGSGSFRCSLRCAPGLPDPLPLGLGRDVPASRVRSARPRHARLVAALLRLRVAAGGP